MKVTASDLKSNEKDQNNMPAIYASMQAVNDELRAIKKDQPGYGYKFRGINQALNTLGPLFRKHKIIVTRTPLALNVNPFDTGKAVLNHAIVQCNYNFVSTVDGSQITTYGFGEGADKLDKALSCADSNAYKYVLFGIFNIETEDLEDSDMKTARENNVEKVEPPKKNNVAKPSSFRQKKVEEVKPETKSNSDIF